MVTMLVPKVKLRPEQRAWLVFFSDGDPDGWLVRFVTRRGFRHVGACSYFADEQRWVFVNPCANRLVVEVRSVDDAGELYDAMLDRAAVVLRVEARTERSVMPHVFCCVGTMKALLGVRSCALSPYGLFRDLVRRGAEIIQAPREDAVVESLQPQDPTAAGGRSGGEAAA